MIQAEKLKEIILSYGASDAGFFVDEEAGMPFPYGISIIVRLSEAVICEINEEPTYTYFSHYRSVNAFIDSLLLKIGLYLQSQGYLYVPVMASQSMPQAEGKFQGRYSHKKGAYLAGLGSIGKNGLLLHQKWGPAVRLGTLFTDAPLITRNSPPHEDVCLSCNRCVTACPAMAISGQKWSIRDSKIVDAQACSAYMKKHFMHIGRGAVCGICIKECMKFNVNS